MEKRHSPLYQKNNETNHQDRYQSVFASEPGAVAAPTASLHFTDNIFAQLRQKNIEIIYITLHIGYMQLPVPRILLIIKCIKKFIK